MNFIEEFIKEIEKRCLTRRELNSLKNKLAKIYKLKKAPTNTELLFKLPEEYVKKYKELLITKPTRTASGVTIIAIMSKPIKCLHGSCIYCPGGPDSEFGYVPQSYTGREPATRRAIRNRFDAYLQVMNRLEQYIALNQDVTKVELIVMGGTFPSFDKRYQKRFIRDAFMALNHFSKLFITKQGINFVKFKNFFELPGDIEDEERICRIQHKLLKLKTDTSLVYEQKRNENSKVKCVGLTLETRPDYGKLKHGNFMLELGCTRVELGVQTIYDDVLKKLERGHKTKDTINSTRILKDLGFKINYHVMLGLPGTKDDLKMLKTLFENQVFRPDMLKIYPCLVLKGTKLYRLWKNGKYKPLTTEEAAKIIIKFKTIVPRYCRIMRIQRDIPSNLIEAGVNKTNLRQLIEILMKKRGLKCSCIRCREPRGRKINFQNIKILVISYKASYGKEFFISAEDVKNDILVGFCRLRFPSQVLRKELKDCGLIRELHVYGSAIPIGKRGEIQHRGVGRRLLKKAEQIVKYYNKKRVIVISGVGARPYYRKFGYRKYGPYMVKLLN